MAFNSILAALCGAGVFFGIEWARNIAYFLSWVIVIACFVCVSSYDTFYKMRRHGRSLPFSLTLSFGLFFIFSFAIDGAYVLAIFLLISYVLGECIYSGDDDDKEYE